MLRHWSDSGCARGGGCTGNREGEARNRVSPLGTHSVAANYFFVESFIVESMLVIVEPVSDIVVVVVVVVVVSVEPSSAFLPQLATAIARVSARRATIERAKSLRIVFVFTSSHSRRAGFTGDGHIFTD